jgi:hypothetical protein
VAILWACVDNRTSDYFLIRVVDDQSGRGVPLVELKLQNEAEYWTDSAGVAALNEPSLHGRKVFVAVRSDGYEVPVESGRTTHLAAYLEVV